jgi:hypothetical protein
MADKKDIKLVTGLFKSRADAESAVRAVLARGYDRDDVTVLMSDATRSKEFAFKTGTKAAEGAGVGGAVGGTVGLDRCDRCSGNTLAIGPRTRRRWAARRSTGGGGAGGVTSGLSACWSAQAFPSSAPRVYEADLREGGILVGVRSEDRCRSRWLEEIFGHWRRGRSPNSSRRTVKTARIAARCRPLVSAARSAEMRGPCGVPCRPMGDQAFSRLESRSIIGAVSQDRVVSS